MRKVIGIGIVLFLLGAAAYGQEPLEVGYGTLKIGGILQAGSFYTFDTTQAVQMTFQMKRARLLFWGDVVPDKVKYFVQTDAVGSPFLLDTKLRFFYIPHTEVTIGRFLPNFTHYMPRSTAMLDMINYPLLVAKYAMWRQIGVQTTTTTDYLDVNLGIFNGYPKNAWSDDNDAKDFFGAAAIKPVPFAKLIGYGWLGTAGVGELDKHRYGGGLILSKALSEQMAVTLKGEGVMGADEAMVDSTINSLGFYGHLGLKLNLAEGMPAVEILGRYDSYDPNTDGDVEFDSETWITTGINLFLDGEHAKISVNYVMKKEEVAEGVEEPDNDEVLGQVQVFF